MPNLDGLSTSGTSNPDSGVSPAEQSMPPVGGQPNEKPPEATIGEAAAADTPTGELKNAGEPVKVDKNLPSNPSDIENKIGAGDANANANEKKPADNAEIPAAAIEPKMPTPVDGGTGKDHPAIEDGQEQPAVTREKAAEPVMQPEAASPDIAPPPAMVTPGGTDVPASETDVLEKPFSPETGDDVPSILGKIEELRNQEGDELAKLRARYESGGPNQQAA